MGARSLRAFGEVVGLVSCGDREAAVDVDVDVDLGDDRDGLGMYCVCVGLTRVDGVVACYEEEERVGE